jgi:hypothetical protein
VFTHKPLRKDPLAILRNRPLSSSRDFAARRAKEILLEAKNIAVRDGCASIEEWLQRKSEEFSRKGRVIAMAEQTLTPHDNPDFHHGQGRLAR